MRAVAVRYLAASSFIDSIMVGDIEIARTEKLLKDLGSTKVKVVRVDVGKRADLVSAIRGCDVVINATWYEHNLDVMKAAADARVDSNDLGGLFHMTRRQMELNDEIQRAGITAVLGGGYSPGITNVLVAACVEKLDSVEEIRIRVGGREKSTSDKLIFPFAISSIFDEYSKSPIMYLNGNFQEVEPLSGSEEVEFLSPVGKNTCHYSIHSEIATLPLNFSGVKNVDFKLGVSERILKAVKPLIDAGLTSTNAVDIKGNAISPRDFALAYLASRASDEEPIRYVALRIEVTGLKEGRKVREISELVGEPSERFGVTNGTALLTGAGAAIFAELLLRAEIGKKGVVAPEACVPPAIHSRTR